MLSAKLLLSLAVLGVAAPGSSALAGTSGARHRLASPPPSAVAPAASAPHHTSPPVYSSRLLWATVDVCNPKDKPGTLGIRGSMPSDGHKGDTIFMRFRLQYEEASKKKWVDVAQNADSGFQQVRRAGAASQAGIDFQVAVPTAGAFTLRGVVSFQWRTGARVVYAATRTTTADHESLAGADPQGFSAATCTIG